MKALFLKKSDIYYSKWASVVQKFQLSMTKLGTHDKIRWFDGMYKYLQPEKIKRIEKSLLLLKNRRIEKSLGLLKNRRIEKSLRLLKNRRTIESLRALKSPRMVKNPRLKKNPLLKKNRQDWKSRRPCLLLRLGGISSCWRLPGLADDLSFRSS